ncbi:MAG: glutamate synthase subunit alpha, partial [Actinobacteria bacterium]|nr:glutamate synthase subunit alpha [Actinomycetota bacterium]
MVATLNKVATHEIVEQGLTALRNLEHRGASGAEVNSGDGAGILTRIPDLFFRAVLNFELPQIGKYAAGIAFVPQDFNGKKRIEEIAQEENITILGWRKLPINPSSLGATALSVMPDFEQLFISSSDSVSDLDLDRRAFCFRKRVEHELSVYFPSLSSRTIV